MLLSSKHQLRHRHLDIIKANFYWQTVKMRRLVLPWMESLPLQMALRKAKLSKILKNESCPRISVLECGPWPEVKSSMQGSTAQQLRVQASCSSQRREHAGTAEFLFRIHHKRAWQLHLWERPWLLFHLACLRKRTRWLSMLRVSLAPHLKPKKSLATTLIHFHWPKTQGIRCAKIQKILCPKQRVYLRIWGEIVSSASQSTCLIAKKLRLRKSLVLKIQSLKSLKCCSKNKRRNRSRRIRAQLTSLSMWTH